MFTHFTVEKSEILPFPPETLWKLYLSTKFPYQKSMWKFGILLIRSDPMRSLIIHIKLSKDVSRLWPIKRIQLITTKHT